MTDKDEVCVSGALITNGMPRITEINEHKMCIQPEEHMLVLPHENKPSMIAKVASVIAADNVNINKMHVADNVGSDPLSIMILSTETKVEANTLKQIADIDGIKDAKYIHLSA